MNNNQFHINYIKNNIPRLLGLIDSDENSKTYGCCDRNYWHYKVKDFPSAITQQAILPLAIIYTFNSPENIYFQSPFILRLIKGIITYTKKIQKKDGSFDEWYFNERGWAGPTAYISHAFAQTYFKLNDHLESNNLKSLKKILHQASFHLSSSNEKHVISNHIAIALLALYEGYLILQEEILLSAYAQRYQDLLNNYQEEEGWSNEYDGADFGYQSATISFLSSLYELNPNQQIKDLCLNGLEFISHFFYPDGSFGGPLGSRQTEVIFHYGIEFWKDKSEVAQLLSTVSLQSLDTNVLLSPQHHDDHYFIYRLLEFTKCLSTSKASQITSLKLPFNNNKLNKFYPLAGLIIKRIKDKIIYINTKRGGIYSIFDINNKKNISSSYAIQFRYNNKKYSTQICEMSCLKKQTKNSLAIEGNLGIIKEKTFTPTTFILFRLFMMIFGRHRKTAYLIKNIIKKNMITSTQQSSFSFKRNFLFTDDKIIIEDCYKNFPIGSIISVGGRSSGRYVPQTKYFTENHLIDSYKKIEITSSSQLYKTEIGIK